MKAGKIIAVIMAAAMLAGCGQTAAPAADASKETEAVSEAAENETAEAASSAAESEAAEAAPETAEAASSAAESEAAEAVPEAAEAASEAAESDTALPAFEYTGEDEYLGVICDYLIANKAPMYSQGDVCIPAPVILQTDESDPDDIKIWGNFWVFNYTLDGTRLQMTSGGEMPGILYLKNDGDVVTVVSEETAGDGQAYAEDIKKFCEGYPGLAEQMMDTHEAANEMQLEMIRHYVENSGAEIDSYQEYGWPAISIETGEEIVE